MLILMVGADVARFNRQFAATGRATTQLRISPTADENVLLTSPNANHNFYVASSFFVDNHTPTVATEWPATASRTAASPPALTSFSNASYEATLCFLAAPAALRVRGPLGLASEQSRLAPSAHALRLLGSETGREL